MAYIQQRGDYWRAQVRRKGHKPVYRTFDTRRQAEKWARHVESEIDAGVFIDRSEAEHTTLDVALTRYASEILPAKAHPAQEGGYIKRWKKHHLAYRMLASLRGVDFARYRDTRLAEGKSQDTVRIELQIVSHLFEIARKEWGMEGLMNPLKNIRKPGAGPARDRRLEAGEYEAIKGYLDGCGNAYAAAAFDLAIETSLRQGKLFALRWEWADLTARLLHIPAEVRRASNKGVPAVVPLTRHARDVLIALQSRDGRKEGLILDTTANAVICVWKRAMAALKIENLRWHDLRHEAASRLFEKGLHPIEVASITGHKSMQMLKRYTHLRPTDLLAKLDA